MLTRRLIKPDTKHGADILDAAAFTAACFRTEFYTGRFRALQRF